jgi:hypothetical protein
MLSELFRLRGEGLGALGRTADALADLRRAEAMAGRDGAGLLQLRAAASLYRLDGGAASKRTLQGVLATFPAGRKGPEIDAARALVI